MKQRWCKVVNAVLMLALAVVMAIFLLPQPAQADPDPGWYDANWAYRRAITVDHTKVEDVADPSTTYANFPVLVYATGLSSIKANGADIRFTSSDGTTELPREIESYSGGTLYAWVKVTLTKDNSDSSDDVIYMYYGNATATEPAPDSTYGSENVWNSNYRGVWHLNETVTDEQTTGTHYDSTSNGNDGTQNENDDTPGKIANGQLFDGGVPDPEYVAVSSLSAPTDKTFSLWIYANALTNNDYESLIEFAEDSPWFGVASKWIELYNEHPYSSSQITTGQWYHIAYTSDNGTNTSKIYIDGAEDIEPTSDQTANTDTGSGMGIAYNSGDRSFRGTIDEVRISDTARSAAWIKTSYNNQNSPAAFYNVGSEEKNWDSYSDLLRTTVENNFSGSTNHVYMKGEAFDTTGTYKIAYYDGGTAHDGADGAKIQVDAYTDDVDGILDENECLFTSYGSSSYGTWHAVVYKTTGTMPNSYDLVSSSDPDYVVEDDFYVDASAIPEFPTVVTAIVVAGLCFVIYYWMRKKRLAPNT